MKKAYICLFIVLGLLICPASGFALNDWTFIVYMVNDDKDNNLENANFRNLSAMKDYGAGENSEIVILMDGGKFGSHSGDKLDYRGGSRLLIRKGKIIDAGVLGEINMGDPYTLWELLKWVHEKHPAKNYALTFNSHGSGILSWRGEGSTSSSIPGMVNFYPDRPSPKPRKRSRFVAYDHTNNDCLTVFEIAEVLKAFNQRLNNGKAFDIVGFDACMPASIETLYQLRDACQFVVGSPETIPIDGFPYGKMVRELYKNSAISNEDYASKMASYMNNRLIGAWRTSGSKQIAFALNNLSMQLINAMDETGKKFGLQEVSAFGKSDKYWDLNKIARSFSKEYSKLAGASNARIIKQMGQELLDAIDSARITKYGVISLFWPEKDDYKSYRSFYKALDLSLDHKWDEVLDYRELGIKK